MEGLLAPNAFGLYDMHGNCWEWCDDVFSKDYGTADSDATSEGLDPSSAHVLRGGFMDRRMPVGAALLPAAYRHYDPFPNSHWNGFRVVAEIPAEAHDRT